MSDLSLFLSDETTTANGKEEESVPSGANNAAERILFCMNNGCCVGARSRFENEPNLYANKNLVSM